MLQRNDNKEHTMFECCVCVEWNAIDINSFYVTIHRSAMYVELWDYVVWGITNFLLYINEHCNSVQLVKNCISKMSDVITYSPAQIQSSEGKTVFIYRPENSLFLSPTHTPPIPFYPENGRKRFIQNSFQDYIGSDTSNSIFCSHCCKNFKSYKIVMLQEVI